MSGLGSLPYNQLWNIQESPVYRLHPPLLLPTTRMFAISVDLSIWRLLVSGRRPVENVAFVSGISNLVSQSPEFLLS